jgi:SpoIIAA-like
MIEQLTTDSDRILGFQIRGRLHEEDYRQFVPVIEAATKAQGQIRLLAEFHDFHGWDLHALWDDVKFAIRHCRDIERVALVGEKEWNRWMAKVCMPFTMAKVKYFDTSEIESAWMWLHLGL